MKKSIPVFRICITAFTGVIIWAFSRSFLFNRLIHLEEPPAITAYGLNDLFINKTFFIIIAVVGIIVLLCFTMAFYYIKEYLPGKAQGKGLLWGIYFYVLYTAAFFEFYTIFGGTLTQALIAGIADGSPLLVTGYIAGLLLGGTKSMPIRTDRIHIISISAAFLIGRIVFYRTLYPVDNLFEAQPLAFIALYGIVLGFGYMYVAGNIRLKHEYIRPLIYAAILLPISLSGNTLVCFKYNVPLLPMAVLTGIDMAAMCTGATVSSLIQRKSMPGTGTHKFPLTETDRNL